MDGQNTVVSRKVEVAAPVLVAIFHNAARAPKVHLHQRVHWLRVRGKVAQRVGAHTADDRPEGVTGRNHPHRRWGIPDVTEV